MKILASQQQLASSHVEMARREVSERLRIWHDRPNSPDNGKEVAVPGPTSPDISSRGRALAMASSANEGRDGSGGVSDTSAIAEAIDNAGNDPVLVLLRGMLERIFGIRTRVFDPSELEVDHRLDQGLQKIERVAASGANWGVEYERHEQRSEFESTRFSASGVVRTADGAEITFELSLAMERQYSERIDALFQAGAAERKKDPLVVNFAAAAAQLGDRRFSIDLDGDGALETARFAAPGSGFLVFDRNSDGIINNGSEMFGPATGDGFAELALLDDDRNGWIDESDVVYGRLQVWTKADDGTDKLRGLKESGVGAISLARIATPFAIKGDDNQTLGQVRDTSVYLGDDGRVGSVQQVDLAV